MRLESVGPNRVEGSVSNMQYALQYTIEAKSENPPSTERIRYLPFKQQLLKWIGNKQRFAHEIGAFFPDRFGTYFEPFLGSGAVLGTTMPHRALGSDCFAPLVGIWHALKADPELLTTWRRNISESPDSGQRVTRKFR